MTTLGIEVLERNVRDRLGEIDIVGRDSGVLCFVEVRSRRTDRFGSPAETVGVEKQRRLRRLAAAYLARRRLECPARFDVASVVWRGGPTVEYIRDAFE